MLHMANRQQYKAANINLEGTQIYTANSNIEVIEDHKTIVTCFGNFVFSYFGRRR